MDFLQNDVIDCIFVCSRDGDTVHSCNFPLQICNENQSAVVCLSFNGPSFWGMLLVIGSCYSQ